MNKLYPLLTVCMIVLAKQAETADWNYEERDYWPYQPDSEISGNQCDGERQSPIDIDTSDVYDEKTALPLIFTDYNKPISGKLSNSGYHTLKFTAPGCESTPYTAVQKVKGGLLNGNEYYFCQLHFHWGSHSNQGSEHTIDGKEYPMEMHLVHYHTDATQAGGASTELSNLNGGALVLAFLFHIGHTTNPDINRIITAMETLPARNSNTAQDQTGMTANVMVWLHRFLYEVSPVVYPEYVGYYTYEGSLTTPPCSEIVTFIVMERTIEITEIQMQKFRNHMVYEDGAPMVDNYRHPQPLNNRIIKRVLFQDNQVTATGATQPAPYTSPTTPAS